MSRFPNGISTSDGAGNLGTAELGATTATSMAATGAVSGATVAATGAVSGGSVAATGAVTGATGTFAGNVSGLGLVGGVTALSKSDNYALAAGEKTLFIGCTMGAGSKTLTLGLAAGQAAIVKNTGGTNAFTVKNVAGDTGTSLATGKSLLIIANATNDASIVIALD
jgi:hypothetical protein